MAFRGVAFVPVKLNSGAPRLCLLDTGRAGTHVDYELAKKLGLEMERGVATVSGNAELQVGVIRSATTQVGDARLEGRLRLYLKRVTCFRDHQHQALTRD